MSKSDEDAKQCTCTGGHEGSKCFECFSSRHERCSKGCALSNYTTPKTMLEQLADDVGELETSVLAQAVPRKKTKEERRAAMYTTYNDPDESFGRCGNCHKPLMTCMCDPDDLDDDDLDDGTEEERAVVEAITPGPWELRGVQIRAESGHGKHVATYQVSRADGLLIASAPTMLETLRRIAKSDYRHESSCARLRAHEEPCDCDLAPYAREV